MNGPWDTARWVSASAVSVATASVGWLNGQNILTALGIVIALLTIVERVYAIRLKRKQLKS